MAKTDTFSLSNLGNALLLMFNNGACAYDRHWCTNSLDAIPVKIWGQSESVNVRTERPSTLKDRDWMLRHVWSELYNFGQPCTKDSRLIISTTHELSHQLLKEFYHQQNCCVYSAWLGSAFISSITTLLSLVNSNHHSYLYYRNNNSNS